jgi:hypothetical protein
MLNQATFGWLTKDSEDMFSGKAAAGLYSTTGNPVYSSLASAVTACQSAFDAYLIAKSNASQGGVDLTSIRNTARADSVALFRALVSNINAIANGDVDKLLSSGFPLRNSNRTPIGPLAAPFAPTLAQGPTTGTLKASVPAVYGASLYTARLALASAPSVYVQTKQQTSARFLFEDLTPGELYNVDVNAIGAAGASDWSDNGTMRVV